MGQRLASARVWCWKRRLAIAAVAVAALGASTHAQVVSFGFIYDDYWTVVSNRHLQRPLGELASAALAGRTVEWGMPDATRPLMGASLWVDRRLFGLSPAGHHLHSLALYGLVCALAFLTAFGVLRKLVPALVAAAAFAVAPLHAEVVAAVNYREDLLAAAGMYGVLALAFWPGSGAALARGIGCGGLWGAALLAKESALVTPALVAALAVVRRPALWDGPARSAAVASCGSVAALWLSWRFGVSRLGEQIPTASYDGWGERLLRSARFELMSLWKSFVPIAPRPERAALADAGWLWALGLAAVVLLMVWSWRRRSTRALAGAALFALVAPAFTSPLIGPLNELADRYFFVGSLACGLGLGWLWQRLAGRGAPLALGALLLGGAVASWKASSVWSSEVSLWTFAAQTAPSSPRAWAALSRVHRLAEQEALAERAVARSLELAPASARSQTTRALNQLWFGDLAGARSTLAALEGGERLSGGAYRAARRCSEAGSAQAARECARRTVPAGLVLGDTERLRAVSERLLGPQSRALHAARHALAPVDAGASPRADAGAPRALPARAAPR